MVVDFLDKTDSVDCKYCSDIWGDRKMNLALELALWTKRTCIHVDVTLVASRLLLLRRLCRVHTLIVFVKPNFLHVL